MRVTLTILAFHEATLTFFTTLVSLMIPVYGSLVDDFTRCTHYHTQLDIIAIKFKCCGRYFPCYQCHDEKRDHEVQRWTSKELEAGSLVILCGSCKKELTFGEYVGGESQCVSCQAMFNPKCALHYDLYFDLRRGEEEERLKAEEAGKICEKAM